MVDLDVRDEFFLRNGKRVYDVREVGKGEVLGVVDPLEKKVSLNYVQGVCVKPSFLKFSYFPSVGFKRPYISFYIGEDSEPKGYKCLTVLSENISGRGWRPLKVYEEFSEEQQEDQRMYLENMDEKDQKRFENPERVYLIENEFYQRMGNLIPFVEVCSMNFLLQSRDFGKIEEMVREEKEDFKLLSEIAERIKKRSKEIGRDS